MITVVSHAIHCVFAFPTTVSAVLFMPAATPLAKIASHRTIATSSFAKLLWNSLRTGGYITSKNHRLN
jgi:hypothetical protein